MAKGRGPVRCAPTARAAAAEAYFEGCARNLAAAVATGCGRPYFDERRVRAAEAAGARKITCVAALCDYADDGTATPWQFTLDDALSEEVLLRAAVQMWVFRCTAAVVLVCCVAAGVRHTITAVPEELDRLVAGLVADCA